MLGCFMMVIHVVPFSLFFFLLTPLFFSLLSSSFSSCFLTCPLRLCICSWQLGTRAFPLSEFALLLQCILWRSHDDAARDTHHTTPQAGNTLQARM